MTRQQKMEILEDAYDKYALELFLYLRLLLSDTDIIQDIIQDTFLKLLTRMDKAPEIENVRGYIYFCAKNALLNHLRDEGNRRRLLRQLYDEHPRTGEELSPEEVRLLVKYTN